eukprot:507742-Pelagomonas_calceolata.AAC.6
MTGASCCCNQPACSNWDGELACMPVCLLCFKGPFALRSPGVQARRNVARSRNGPEPSKPGITQKAVAGVIQGVCWHRLRCFAGSN